MGYSFYSPALKILPCILKISLREILGKFSRFILFVYQSIRLCSALIMDLCLTGKEGVVGLPHLVMPFTL